MVLKEATKKVQSQALEHKLAIYPGESEISHVFKTNFASIFVNARTGEIKIRSEIFVEPK